MMNVEDVKSPELVIASALDHRNSQITLIEKMTQQKNDLLRDYSVTGIAIVGTAVTILTAKPSLVGATGLFYLGTLLALFSVLLAFFIRHQLIDNMQMWIGDAEIKYGKRAVAARAVLHNPKNKKLREELDDILVQTTGSLRSKRFTEKGHVAVGTLLFLGALTFAAALMI